MTTFTFPIHVEKKSPFKYREDNVDEWFTPRPKEESPIYRRMIHEAVASGDPERIAKARAYGEKLDAVAADPCISFERLPYEGPDLSPGATRLNSMKGVLRTLYHTDGERKGFGNVPPEEGAGLRGKTSVSPVQWKGNDRLAMDNT